MVQRQSDLLRENKARQERTTCCFFCLAKASLGLFLSVLLCSKNVVLLLFRCFIMIAHWCLSGLYVVLAFFW